MSTNSQDQEIDLGQIGTGIKSLFNGIINSVFDFIFFVKKKIIVIGFLFVLGVVLGSIPFYIPSVPIAVKIGMAGGPLSAASGPCDEPGPPGTWRGSL